MVPFRLLFDQVSAYCGLVKLTHKMNHYSRETGNHFDPSNPASSAWWLGFLRSSQPTWSGRWILLEETFTNKHSVNLMWSQIFSLSRNIFPDFLNPLFLRLVSATPLLLFGKVVPGLTLRTHLLQTHCWSVEQPSKIFEVEFMPLGLCFVIVWFKDF